LNCHSNSRREFLQQSAAALAFGGAASLASSQGRAETPQATSLPVPHRQAIACSELAAADAARQALLEGGNAIDAAIAALLVLCVTEPWNVGLGGYGGSLVTYQAKTNRVHAIEFTMRAPRQFDADAFNRETANHGYLAVGVPGVVAGIDLALREFGSMPFKSLATPALALAEDGIAVSPRMAGTFKSLEGMDDASRRALFPEGVPVKGGTWKQKDLACLIRLLSNEGLGSFYAGDVAAAILRQVHDGGGVLSEEDFHGPHAVAVEPLEIDYRGHSIYSPPPPSAGVTAMSILKTLEQFDRSNEFLEASFIGRFIDAANLAWRERAQYLGDPDFADAPLDELLSHTRAAERAELIRTGQAEGKAQPAGPEHTANLVVADKDQNIVSWTATHGNLYGSHVAIEGLGLILGHGMSRFDFDGDHPNYPVAGKRPQHNMAPLVVLREGKPCLGIGMPGGTRIITVTAQVAANLLAFAAPPEQAVNAPRFHTEGDASMTVTSGMPEGIVKSLRKQGRRVNVASSLGGGVNAVTIDPQTGHAAAVASRGATGAIAF
jgi:gamma-glutamyltranspeptidase / glutathione hydrolase